MFKRTKPDEQVALEKEIASVHASMTGMEAHDEEYAKCMKHLSELHKLLDAYRSERVNPNTVITTLGSFFSVAYIVSSEQVRPFTSKAIQFVKQAR